MKRLIAITFFTVVCGIFGIQSAFAGPFGIDMGMSIAEVRQVCRTVPEHIEDDVYIITPPKTNDLFEMYAVRIDPIYGVYWLKAVGKEIHTNDYGHELIGTFNNLVTSISKTYGDYEMIDRKDGYLGDKPEYFMHALREGDRTLMALWAINYRSIMPEDIALIGIMVNAHKYLSDVGFITLEYSFSNEDAVKSKTDSVF